MRGADRQGPGRMPGDSQDHGRVVCTEVELPRDSRLPLLPAVHARLGGSFSTVVSSGMAEETGAGLSMSSDGGRVRHCYFMIVSRVWKDWRAGKERAAFPSSRKVPGQEDGFSYFRGGLPSS